MTYIAIIRDGDSDFWVIRQLLKVAFQVYKKIEIVAAGMYDFDKEKCRGLKAKPDLKQKIYETDNIPYAFQSGQLEATLSTYIVPETLQEIYRQIPEARRLLQIISYC